MANTTADKLNKLKETKTAIKDAIVAKGVDVPEGTVFSDYTGKIGEIDVSLPELINPATAIEVAEGKQFINENGEKVTGSLLLLTGYLPITKRENGDFGLGTFKNQLEITIFSYNDYLVKRNVGGFTAQMPLSDFGDATAEDVAAGKTFTSADGLKVTGTASTNPLDSLEKIGFVKIKSGNYYYFVNNSWVMLISSANVYFNNAAVYYKTNSGSYGEMDAGGIATLNTADSSIYLNVDCYVLSRNMNSPSPTSL